MKDIVKVFMLVINIISFICVLIIAGYFLISEFIGYDKTESFLKKLNIPWSLDSVIVMGLISAIVSIITYFLRKKFFGA